MAKTLLVALLASMLLAAGDAPGSVAARLDVSIPMDDGVSVAATLYVPDGAAPTGGWPAIVFLHGLSGNRQQLNALVEGYGFSSGSYAVLSFDARGHGGSGGLVGIDGPREVADIRAIRDWLAARPDVSDTRIGAWGISYGGGGIFNSLVAGVPWAAVVTVETWTDLYSALMPQGLVKSGLVAGLAGSIPPEKRDPSLDAVTAAAFAGNTAAVRPWAAERSSLSKLGAVTTPVFMAQGRRDFLFGIDQGARAFQRLKGPKTLYVGLHGHAPSTFPAPDTGFLMERARAWFDCHLRTTGCDGAQASVYVASEKFSGQVPRRGTVPPVSPTFVSFPGVTTFARSGKAVRTSAPLRKAIEVYGAPTVRTSIAASGGWSRLVAVLTARTPAGKEILISAGGVPTKPGAQKVTIQLINQATFVPRGSRLTLTLASSSTAQSTANLLYLDLPMAQTARARIGTAVLKLPGLRTPVTK
ncbi:MAG TPA: CocE/NonD family hydrolase [Gaiellaceae bacterium]|nr:CocE/NonD family hydrolase [Gaiellaceae bacterium]